MVKLSKFARLTEVWRRCYVASHIAPGAPPARPCAEYERDMIVERTQTGRAYARTHVLDYREGRKPVINGRRLEQMLEYYDTHTVKETVSAFGVSKATLMRSVAERKAQALSEQADK